DALDVKAMYAQFLSGQYTAYPHKSLTSNVGFDGSGTYCYSTSRFNAVLSDQCSFSFPDDVIIDQRIVESNRKFRAAPGSARRLMEKLLGIYKRCSKMFESQLM